MTFTEDQRGRNTNQAIEGNLPRPTGRLLRSVRFTFTDADTVSIDTLVRQGFITEHDAEILRTIGGQLEAQRKRAQE